jgi:quercetin dioxygenase-like cupin family protein
MLGVRALFVGASLLLGVAAATAQTYPDSTVAAPDVHQVVLENEHVRVLQVLARAGTKTAMHSHPPMLVVSLETARVRFTSPDGKSQIQDLRPGTLLWIDGVEHAWELLAGQVNIVAVEVKSAKAAKLARAR